MKKIIIIGLGSHAKVVADEINRSKKYKILGFVDAYKKISYMKPFYKNLKVLGGLDFLKKKTKSETIMTIGSNHKRISILNKLSRNKQIIKWAKIISKNAIISESVKIGEGSVIISGSIINTDTKIGCHCLINTGSIIEHDNFLGDFSSTGPGVQTGGNVQIGNESFIGMGSSIRHNIKIGKNVVIGANSFVNKDCQKNSTYFGLPAKRISSRTDSQKYL